MIKDKKRNQPNPFLRFINTRYTYILLVLILFLGISLRAHNINTWPRTGATFDEYAWTWLGISLIQNQYPQSWSPHPQYTDRKQIVYRQTHFMIVKPYLEHPPLFGLVAGSYALLNNVDGMFDVDVAKIRGLALILGAFSIGGVFLLTTKIYGQKLALVASFLYAITPTIAIGSRLVQNENFFIPFFLFALWLIARYLDTNKRKYYFTCAVICGLLILAKIPWVAATGAVMMILLYKRRFTDTALFVGITLVFFTIYLVYGFYFDATLFTKLWGLQLQRYDIAFNSIFALFTAPYLADRFFLDGWIYFGWFAFLLLLTKDLQKHFIIIFGMLAYFLIFVFAIPNEPGHGWYRYPFYPFLTIGIAYFLKEYFVRNLILTFFFLIFTGLSLLQVTWQSVFGFSYVVFRGILLFYGMTLFPLFFSNKKIQKFSMVMSYTSFLMIVILSVWAIVLYNEQ